MKLTLLRPHSEHKGTRAAQPNLSGTRDRFCGRQFFHRLDGGGWFGDDSSALQLSCTLCLLVLYQLNLSSSGLRFQRLGTPALDHSPHHLCPSRCRCKVSDENGKSVRLFLPEPHTPIFSQPGHAFSQGRTARGHLRSSASTVTQARRAARDISAPFYACCLGSHTLFSEKQEHRAWF